MSTEDLVIEAFRDLVKDELKLHIRNKVDADPELKEEIKDAVSYYFQSKARSIYAELKATRAATRLGLRLLPDDLQGEVGEALVSLFEKELGVKSILLGFGLDSDAIHSPNEHYGIFNYLKGIETIPLFFKNYAEKF